MSNKKLRIVPLGGLGEIGKNMMVYEYGREYPDRGYRADVPRKRHAGDRLHHPRFRISAKIKRNWIRGIVITHGHEDHTGAIAHVVEQYQRADLCHAADPRAGGSQALARRA